jgi:hypothetical protein
MPDVNREIRLVRVFKTPLRLANTPIKRGILGAFFALIVVAVCIGAGHIDRAGTAQWFAEAMVENALSMDQTLGEDGHFQSAGWRPVHFAGEEEAPLSQPPLTFTKFNATGYELVLSDVSRDACVQVIKQLAARGANPHILHSIDVRVIDRTTRATYAWQRVELARTALTRPCMDDDLDVRIIGSVITLPREARN